MAQFTITLPDAIIVTVRKDVSVTLDTTRLTAETVATAALHGFNQKIIDAAAGAAKAAVYARVGERKEGESLAAYDVRVAEAAKVMPESEVKAMAKELMGKIVDALHDNIWNRRGVAGIGYDMEPIEYAARMYEARLVNDIPGFAKMKKAEWVPLVDAWLDDKEGRRATIVGKIKAERDAMADI